MRFLGALYSSAEVQNEKNGNTSALCNNMLLP